MLRPFIALCLLLTLTACGGRGEGFVRIGDYEGDAGEAVVRHLIANLPPLDPGVPKEYCIIKALDLRATDMEFTKRFADLKLVFVSRDVLTEHPETHYPIQPRSGLTPVQLHLKHMSHPEPATWVVEAGWAYKNTFEKQRLTLSQAADGKCTVTKTEKLESNVKSAAPAAPASPPAPAQASPTTDTTIRR